VELDYLLTTRLGPDAELDFLEGLTNGAYLLIHPTDEDLLRCRELIAQYFDLSLGLADASVVVTAERLGVSRLLTLDERHFRAVQPRSFSHFILPPADSP
jgi:predicted nucleic acid-binding protein